MYDAFHELTDEEFSLVYGFGRPPVHQALIVYCHFGVKARTAADMLAFHFGYQAVKVYLGSWVDWTHNQGSCSASLPLPREAGDRLHRRVRPLAPPMATLRKPQHTLLHK